MYTSVLRRLFPLVAALLLVAGCPDGKLLPDAGSDVTLDPPAAGTGFQLATDTFDVAAGTEDQRCYFFAVPGTGTDPVWIDHMVAALNPGSHHMNMFRVKTVVKLTGKPGDVVIGGECWKSGNWADWPLVINSQESTAGKNTVDWQLPANVAHKFTPGELLMLQIHYVNATTQSTPGHGKGLFNFYNYKGAGTPMELGTVFATNQNIRICPGDMNKQFSTTCRFAKDGPVTIIGANGHFHSRGTEFDINAVDANNNPMGGAFYTSKTWNDPPFLHDLTVQLPQNGGIGWTCAYDYAPPAHACPGMTAGTPGGDGMMPMPNGNCVPYDNMCMDAASSCCISFGGHVEVQEHCNAFVYYYPKSSDASCF